MTLYEKLIFYSPKISEITNLKITTFTKYKISEITNLKISTLMKYKISEITNLKITTFTKYKISKVLIQLSRIKIVYKLVSKYYQPDRLEYQMISHKTVFYAV